MTTKDCEHKVFEASVEIHRMEDTTPMAYIAEIRISCADCDESFRFVGLPAGLNFSAPTVSVDGLVMNAPIQPEGEPKLVAGPVIFRMPKSGGES